eukprot:1556-Heterococcus_DN1.PRE.1
MTSALRWPRAHSTSRPTMRLTCCRSGASQVMLRETKECCCSVRAAACLKQYSFRLATVSWGAALSQ